MRKLWTSMMFGLVMSVASVHAQEAPEVQRARVLQVELNACDLTQRRLRQTLAEELRQALDRAEVAEQRAKKLETALAAKLMPTPPPAPEQPGSLPEPQKE